MGCVHTVLWGANSLGGCVGQTCSGKISVADFFGENVIYLLYECYMISIQIFL